MTNSKRLIRCLIALAMLSGCVISRDPNLREVMLQSAQEHNNRFPDGKELRLTTFSHFGKIKTKKGTFEVVECRAVILGMLSPRGQSWLSFHDENGKYSSGMGTDPMVRPLWCEGSKIYFFGTWGAGRPDKDGQAGEGGNVVDFANGLDNPEWKMEDKEGS